MSAINEAFNLPLKNKLEKDPSIDTKSFKPFAGSHTTFTYYSTPTKRDNSNPKPKSELSLKIYN